MVLSLRLAEEVPWSNFLWKKLMKIVSCFTTFLVNINLEILFLSFLVVGGGGGLV